MEPCYPCPLLLISESGSAGSVSHYPKPSRKKLWGDPTWRVHNKIFAMEKRGDVWCKAPPGSGLVLVGADPQRFFVPPYVGHTGWVGMRLDDGPDWDEVAALLTRSYRLIAPNGSPRCWSKRQATGGSAVPGARYDGMVALLSIVGKLTGDVTSSRS